MNVRQIAIIGGALIIAGGAFMWMRAQGGAVQQTGSAAVAAVSAASTVQVLVAKRDLTVGDRITPDSLAWQDWPATGTTSAAFFTQSKTPDALKSFENGVVRQEMATGEPITDKKIVAVDAATSSMAALLTPGMRATSVIIRPESGVAGFVLPNDRVDIVLTREIQIESGGQMKTQTQTSTIIENVRVLAIDQAVAQVKDQKAMAGSTATVELISSDVEKLRLAAKLGEVSLTLRGYSDAAGPTITSASASAIMAQPTADAPGRRQSASNAPAPSPQEGLTPSSAAPQPDGSPAAQTAQVSSVKVYRGGQ